MSDEPTYPRRPQGRAAIRYPLSVADAVSADADRIAGLRQSDAAFAEACDDYELLAREFRATTAQAIAPHALQETLDGLRAEIADRLRRADAAPHPPDGTKFPFKQR